MTDRYRIKTSAGYYYSTGNGRYGRFDGQRLYGEVLCKEHAEEIVNNLKELVPQIEADLDVFKGHAVCRICQREK